jgi:hypothetical protein
MRDAYVAALKGTALLPSDPAGLERLFTACELHRAVYRLAHAERWRLSHERIEASASEVCEIAQRFERERA